MFNKIRNYFTHEDKIIRDNRWIFITILVASIISLIAAFTLSIEAFELAKNTDAKFTCDINSIVSCGAVARTSWATMFGFPNSFIGLIVQPAMIMFVLALMFGTKFPKHFASLVQVINVLAVIFAYFLFAISLLYIHAICPWCLAVMFAETFVFFALTRYNIREENIHLPRKWYVGAKKLIDKDYDKLVLACVIVIDIAILIASYGSKLFA